MTTEKVPELFTADQLPDCVLPHREVQEFLLKTIASATYPGNMSEAVSQVKALIKGATIKQS